MIMNMSISTQRICEYKCLHILYQFILHFLSFSTSSNQTFSLEYLYYFLWNFPPLRPFSESLPFYSNTHSPLTKIPFSEKLSLRKSDYCILLSFWCFIYLLVIHWFLFKAQVSATVNIKGDIFFCSLYTIATCSNTFS